MIRRLVLGLALLAIPAVSEAGGLNLVQGFPDITAAAPTVNYNASSDVFTVADTVLSFKSTLAAPSQTITGGNYLLSAFIDSAEQLTLPGSQLSINGTLGSDSGSLLTGDLTAFGFSQNFVSPRVNATFEFLFTVTGGALADQFGGVGAQGGVIISASKTALAPINFASNFNFTPVGSTSTDADTFAVVPEPASMASLAVGLVGLGAVARYRRRGA